MENSTRLEIETRSKLGRFLESWRGEAYGLDPTAVDPKKIERAYEVLGHLFGPGRYFEVETTGITKVPEAPSIVVANHSGGTSIPDVWGLGYAWMNHFGGARPMHPLAHDMVFAFKWPGKSFEALGILRASREMGLHILKSGHDLLVMPGGDVETWRPWRERFKLRWSGRRGYAWLSIKTGSPIVPLACAGAHDTLCVLTDGRGIARRLGLPALARAEIFPIHLSLPWGIGIGPLPHIPIPTVLRYKFGEPITPPPLGATGVPDAAQVEALDTEVRAAMQQLLNELRAEDPPLREKVRRFIDRSRRRKRPSMAKP